MAVLTFWDVVERTSHGERMKESDFDAMLYQIVRQVIEKYDIHFDGETAVPSDDGLADRAYQAALELFVATGFYCTSTRRVVRFTREEVEEAVRHAETQYVFGEGRERHVMGPRTVEDPEPPTCIFSHLGVPVKQDLFPKVCLAQAQEQYADAFCCVSLHDTFRGIPIKSGHPVEIAACMWDVSKRREAARLAGRPGLGLYAMVSVGESTSSIIAAAHPAFGALPRDVPQVGAIAELKVDYERMNKVAFEREAGIGLAGLYGPLMGGYAGGPEGTMLVQIAHFFLGLLAYDVEYHICFPIDIRETCSTTLPMLWLVSVYCQAIARNSNMLNICTTMAAGGPATDMLFYEMVNGAIAHTVSGAHSVQGGIARDKYPERIGTLELRLGAETCHAVARSGMTRAEANSIVKEILARYGDQVHDAPLGMTFSELYDLERVRPLDFYVDMYEKKKEEMRQLGIDYSAIDRPRRRYPVTRPAAL